MYVISKGRADACLTANFLVKDGVPFHLVVEPQEAEAYAEKYGAEKILELPFSNLGLGGIPARNWVWEHSKAEGHKRHWILDDNIYNVHRLNHGRRIVCSSGVAFRACEDFTERYENIAISGLNYSMFAIDNKGTMPPFYLNVHVYSCLLILNSLPNRWRGRYNEDTDLCLQVLAAGWCTVLFNAFTIAKVRTMTMKGGNSAELYRGDGRLKMASALKRMWPYVVGVDRRWGRPQHIVRDQWKKFDTQLVRRKDVDFSKLKRNDYGMKVVQVSPTKSATLKKAMGVS